MHYRIQCVQHSYADACKYVNFILWIFWSKFMLRMPFLCLKNSSYMQILYEILGVSRNTSLKICLSELVILAIENACLSF